MSGLPGGADAPPRRAGPSRPALPFDPQRGVAFSTYAGVAIQRRIWRAAKQTGCPQGEPLQAALPDVRAVLGEAVSRLPERLCQVVCAAYGLDGAPPRTLEAIGQRFGVTREMVRYWRNNTLLLLRLPAFSQRLHQVYGQDSRPAYARSQALTRAWLRGRRRR